MHKTDADRRWQRRDAKAEDTELCITLLQEAFASDPFLLWLLHDSPRPRESRERLFAVLVEHTRRYGRIDLLTSPTLDALLGVGLWFPPDRWPLPFSALWYEGRTLLSAIGLWSFLRKIRPLLSIQAHHPKQPYTYLSTFAIHPRHQGRGWGRLFLQDALLEADAARNPAQYLETSKAENLAFYRSLGFDRVGEIPIPDGPTIYRMLRLLPPPT